MASNRRATPGPAVAQSLRGRGPPERPLNGFHPRAGYPADHGLRVAPATFPEQSLLSMMTPDQPLRLPELGPPRIERHRSRLSTLQSQDGTELYIRCDRGNMHRETHAPALGLSLGELRSKQFNARLTPPASPNRRSRQSGFLSRDRADTESVKYEMVELAGDSSGRVQVDNLGDLGFTTEDLSRVIYDKFKDEDLPDFLDYVALEKKGGLNRISEIWYPEKYLWFFCMIGSVLFNTTYLISMDWAIFQSFTTDTFQRFEGVDFTNVTQAYSHLVESSAQTADIFKSINDPQTRWILLNIAALVATWEVCWILVKIVHTLLIWWMFFMARSEYKSFHAVVYFFQKLLPQFSTFSAIKLMAKVHPSLIYNEYLYFVNESSLRGSKSGLVLVSVYFFSKCAGCALAAIGAFAIKLLAVSLKLMNPSYSLLYRLGNVAALMNQCMGCVIMEIVLQDRLFLFVFGGQDAMYKDREHAYKNVYECRVARQIWQDFWNKGRRLQAVVLLATFDHYDLQRLLIERLEDGNDLEVRVGGLLPIDEASPRRERAAEEDMFGAVEPPESLASRCRAEEFTPRSEMPWSPRRRSLIELPSSKRDISIVRHDDPPVWPARDGQEDATSEVSRCDSRGSFGSVGMHAVTRCLQDEAEWRDSV